MRRRRHGGRKGRREPRQDADVGALVSAHRYRAVEPPLLIERQIQASSRGTNGFSRVISSCLTSTSWCSFTSPVTTTPGPM